MSNDEEKAIPHPVLDNDYEIKSCNPEPNEEPARNKAEEQKATRNRSSAPNR